MKNIILIGENTLISAAPFALPLLLLFAQPLVFGQLAPSDASQKEKDKMDTITLSPFEVKAEATVGYLANNTLAGTRINTQLKDIANSVQVLTKEFLSDVGADNVGNLLIYTTSTEAYGENGNASFSQFDSQTARNEFARREPQLNTRVRGLSRADLTRDYFLSSIAVDPYITAEVTINRGPNASLFGLGSPGGIINSSIDRAQTDRNFREVKFKTDEFGSTRVSLNFNQVLLKDKLAIRLAGLDSEESYEQEQSFNDEQRKFVAVTWRPLRNARNLVIRANYEAGSSYSSRPELGAPTDRISGWLANGKPSYNPTTNQWYVNGALVTNTAHINALASVTTQYASLVANGNPISVFDDPNSAIAGNLGGYAAMQGGFQAAAAGRTSTSFPITTSTFLRMWNGERPLIRANPLYIIGARPEISAADVNYYVDPQITDLNIINYRKYNLSGPNNTQEQDFKVYTARVENTWLNGDLGVELAYSKEHWEANLAQVQSASSGNTLNVDINLVLMNGSPNPNYGRPFIGGRGFSQGNIIDRESNQAVGFYKYDFAKKHTGWLRHLGGQTLTAVYQNQKNQTWQPNRMFARASSAFNPSVTLGGPGLTLANAAAINPRPNGNLRNTIVQYLGPSLANASSLQGASIQGVTAFQTPTSTNNALLWNPFNSAWQKGSIDWLTYYNDPDAVLFFGNPLNADKIDSISAVLQSKFLGDRLVTTASWRRDAVKTYVGVGPTDPATGLYLPVTPPWGDPVSDISVSKTSYGGVFHVPDKWLPSGAGLSFHYVNSQNFAAGVSGVNIFGDSMPPQTGKTKEYGFSVSLFKGKLYLRANHFDTGQVNTPITGALPGPADHIVSVMQNNTPAQLAAAGFSLTDPKLFSPGLIKAFNIRPANPNVPNNQTTWSADNIAGTSTNYYQDTVTKGDEFEITYAPTKDWRIAFNAASAVVEVNNVMRFAAPELRRIVNQIYLDPKMGNLFINPAPFLPDGSVDPLDILSSRASSLLNGIAAKQAPEGGPLPDVRKWRSNLITNYKFNRDSRLSGFSVGAAVRWQGRVFIGSALKIVDGATVPDYSKQYLGPAETNVDSWITYDRKLSKNLDIQLQLRVRNLTSGDGDLIPTRANPDGQIALYRIGAPRYFEFSSTLKF